MRRKTILCAGTIKEQQNILVGGMTINEAIVSILLFLWKFTENHTLYVAVPLLSHVWLFVSSWTAAHQASLSFTVSQSLLKLMSVESMMPSNQLILCCPLLFLPSIFPSIRIFSKESALRIMWPKYWSFNFSISPSNEYSGLKSLQSKGLSWDFSSITVWKHQFFSIQLFLWFLSHIGTWLLEKTKLWLYGALLAKRCLCFSIL